MTDPTASTAGPFPGQMFDAVPVDELGEPGPDGPPDEPMFDAPRKPPTVLHFTGKLAGLRVTMRTAPQAQLRAAASLAELSDDPEITDADAGILLGLIDSFGAHLVSWNLRDPDTKEPIPPTPAGIASLDDRFAFEIIMGWLATVELPDRNQPPAPSVLDIPQEPLPTNAFGMPIDT